jgi:hypothetical protein
MAGFMLGNLSVEEMEQRTGAVWPDELKQYMADKHQSHANDIRPGKWHCFDIPFMLVCGDMDTAQAIYDYLSPMHADFQTPLQIGVQ